MKKSVIVVLTGILLVTIVVVAGCSKGYETKKAAGDLMVTLSAGSYPLVKGDNTLTIKVADSSGKVVTDAKVEARYYMPAMPGMAPMEFTTQAAPRGSAYTLGANIPMEGGWRVDVSITRGDKLAPTVTFNVDAR